MIDVSLLKETVDTRYAIFGVNQRREIKRLIFEITKKEKTDFNAFIAELPQAPCRYTDIKKALIKKRYPLGHKDHKSDQYYLAPLDIHRDLHADTARKPFIPKNIYVEKEVLKSDLLKRIRMRFSTSRFEVIPSYKEFISSKRFSVKDYNSRNDYLFLIKEKFDFFKKCPCGPGSVPCGYHNVNLGVGCPFECTYCYLQNYVNAPGITLPANLSDFFEAFKRYGKNVRVGSGELADSLAFDHLTEFSRDIVEFFRQYRESVFEFKTKSKNIDILTSIKGAENIVVSWSVNPQGLIDTCEYKTASLEERLASAARCVEAGYRVAFHFDPIIDYSDWKEEYLSLVDNIFNLIQPSRISWISLGGLRLATNLKKVIESRFTDNALLNGELFLGYDSKLRYSRQHRKEMYCDMLRKIRSFSERVPVYLCMEEELLWNKCGLKKNIF